MLVCTVPVPRGQQNQRPLAPPPEAVDVAFAADIGAVVGALPLRLLIDGENTPSPMLRACSNASFLFLETGALEGPHAGPRAHTEDAARQSSARWR
jgi:hypothetical protein